LQWLLDTDGPALLEVVTDQKVPVLPMVPGGNALHEFILYDESTLSHYSMKSGVRC
jgi:acetolactate synthase-1/2/3 large subunit